MILDTIGFRRQFDRFERLIMSRSGTRFVSFQEGLAAEWEGYKETVRTIARDRLGFHHWKARDIGTGTILNHLLQAIEISPTPDIPRNNLVAWQPRYGAKSQPHRALLDARKDRSARRRIEQWLFAFYGDDLDDAQAFEELITLVGRRYDLAAYLFFLKDWRKFMPIAPTTFDKAFAKLGISLKTARQCSWDNYRQYNEALQQICLSLREVEEINARLVDAHSFCWLLVHLGSAQAAGLAISAPMELSDVKAASVKESNQSDATRLLIVTESEFRERDDIRRRIGKLAEDYAFESEQLRLRKVGRADLAQQVQLVSDQPLLGYDIRSFESDGTSRYIEVKAARASGSRLEFILTRNEWLQCRSLPNYHFYLVIEASGRKPKVFAVNAVRFTDAALSPVAYRVGLIRKDRT